MAYEVEFTPEGYVRVRVHGEDSPADMVERIDRIVGDDRWRPGSAVLIDLREASTATFSNEDLRAMTDYHTLISEKLGPCRLAFVSSGGPVYGVTRMWEAHGETSLGIEIQAFEDPDEAVQWLTS